MDLFKKSVIAGVAITPGIGIELALIDSASETILKYGSRPLDFDNNMRTIVDLDLFKEALSDLCSELAIAKGTKFVISVPTVSFSVKDYPAAMNAMQIGNALEEDVIDLPYFKNDDPAVAYSLVRTNSMQFKKTVCAADRKRVLIEMLLAIKDLGYGVQAIEPSETALLRTLIYKQRVDVSEQQNWVLLVVGQSYCRAFNLVGTSFMDAYEEPVRIGQVLGDAENYGTVVQAVSPILKNMPAKYLCVVSTTDIISAEVLASKLNYPAPIVYQESNAFSKEQLLEISPDVDSESAGKISLSAIGAAIREEFMKFSEWNMNLYNESLGDIYFANQPPMLSIFGLRLSLTNSLLAKWFIMLALVIVIIVTIVCNILIKGCNDKQAELDAINNKIIEMEAFLKENEKISSDLFNEGDEIRIGIVHNKDIYSFLTIVGTEIPKKAWLTHLKFGDKITIDGQADNLESVYAFFRSIRDYVPTSGIKLQKLGLATNTSKLSDLTVLDDDGEGIDTQEFLTSLNADFYEFRISNDNSEKINNIKNSKKKKIDQRRHNGVPSVDIREN